MFLAAFTSRSWLAPQEEHSHALIPSPVIPFGRPLDSREPQQEQVWAVNRSSTSTVLLALVAGGVNRIGTVRCFPITIDRDLRRAAVGLAYA
jgi:hypothetical protein